MKKKEGIVTPTIKATYLNHTNKPTSNRGGDLVIEVTEIVTQESINEIQERANQIVKERRFISKAEAAEILGCSVRTIDRKITKDEIEIYQFKDGESGDTLIYKDRFYKKYGIK